MSANAATASPLAIAGTHRATTSGRPDSQDRVAPEALHGEGRLGVDAPLRQTLPEQAQVERGDITRGGSAGVFREQSRQQTALGEDAKQLSVHPAGHAAGGDRREHLAGQSLRLLEQTLLPFVQREGRHRPAVRQRGVHVG